MEKLLHYTWKHKLLPLATLTTTDGAEVEVIDPGRHNASDAGPDFFNAKVKIGGLLWAGNVELHLKASDWYRHHHDTDAAYNNVVLHVVTEADAEAATTQGFKPPTLVLPIAESLRHDYESLLRCDRYPPCYRVIPSLPPLKVVSWLSALQAERLEQKTRKMEQEVERLYGSWDDAYFATLARNFGFGINGSAFEEWVRHIPLRSVDHHRDDLFQVETIFIGQAGLLDRVPARYAAEYAYLQKKFGLTPMDPALWRYLRTRPQNFPHNRIMQLARMHHERRTGISSLIECRDIEAIGALYGVKGSMLHLLVINTAIPAIFAYGRHHNKEHLCERAADLLSSLPAEANHITRLWQECGLRARNAGDSQALIQLKKQYCDHKDCLRCRFGYEFLTSNHRNAFLAEG